MVAKPQKCVQVGSSRWLWLALALLFVIGVGLRIAIQNCFVGVNYAEGISGVYESLANHLVETGRYVWSGSGTPCLSYPPGYPLYLALWKWFGADSFQFAIQAQCVIDSLGILLCYWIGVRCGLRRSMAFLFAVCYAVFFPFLFGAGTILAEAFSPIFVLIAVAGGIWVVERPSLVRVLLVGVPLGIAPLVRPDLLFLPFCIIAFWLFRMPWRRTVPLGLSLLIIWFIPTMLWGIHNKVHHDTWIFTSTSGGVGLWEGLGEIPNDHGFILSDEKTGAMLREKGLGWHTIESDQYLKQEYLRAWREHPGFVLRVIGHRWLNILSHPSTNDRRFPLSSFFTRLRGLWLALGVVALLIERRNWNFIWSFLLPVLYACLSIGLVHWEPRYVRYVDIAGFLAVIMLLSWGWRHGPATWRTRPWKHDLLPATLSVVLVGIVSMRVWGESRLATASRESRDLIVGFNAGNLPQNLRVIPLLDHTKQSPAAVSLTNTAVTINGASASRYQYIASWHTPPDLGAGTILVFRGTLDAGGITIGLLDSAGSWILNKNIRTIGQFRHAFSLEGNTIAEPVVANCVDDAAQETTATVHLELLTQDP